MDQDRDDELLEIDQDLVVINSFAKKAWLLLKQTYPMLKSVKVKNLSEEFSIINPRVGGIYIHPNTFSTQEPLILMAEDWQSSVQLKREADRYYLLEQIAKKLSISIGRITDDMLAAYILLHEAGHAVAYYNKSLNEFQAERVEELTLLPAKSKKEFFNKFPRATEEDWQEVQRQYRTLPSELFADNFALSFMQQHFQTLFEVN